MTDETPNEPDSFAAFETEATADNAPPAKEPEKKDDTLELGSDEAPELTDEQKAAEAEKKSRGRPWQQRVDTLTARLRETERERDELKAKTSGQPSAAPTLADLESTKPNPDEFEFGIADPDYQDKLTDWKLDVRDAQKRDEGRKADEAKTVDERKQKIIDRVSEGVTNIEKAGTEKYDDFEQVISAATEARGGEPLGPLISVGIAVSPVGQDVIYHLAKDSAASDKLEQLAQTSPQAAAVAFGEIEGQYTDSDDDLDLADGMDMARLVGRMKARLAGRGGQSSTERKVTKAPEPPEHRSRGSNGQFETKADTPDFKAFEAMANKQNTARR